MPKLTITELALTVDTLRTAVMGRLDQHDIALKGLAQAVNALLAPAHEAAATASAAVPVTRVASAPEPANGYKRVTVGKRGKVWAWPANGGPCEDITATAYGQSLLAGSPAPAKASAPAKAVAPKAPKAKRPLPINPETGERFTSVRAVIAAHKARKAAATAPAVVPAPTHESGRKVGRPAVIASNRPAPVVPGF